ncbi:phosphodiester glycosidase family protein [Nereida sp. MMG025]|uniref:phosphodiester glycosidase family protein n=1 Tax=Nereida sp. MMG025 TaxID=2909981 RepID=UPI001F3B2389|nr:phosphodiester glycosidase family protein [Nereida sp. MMG025]MCF6444840.1 phosphodiester glycosidase family protein [Nereida sp. MMG025]
MRVLAALFFFAPASAEAVTCTDLTYEGLSYTHCEVSDPSKIDLHLRDPEGDIIGTFRRLETLQGSTAFAMNAGMYHADRDPVGHYVENGKEEMRVIPNAGPGNFGLLPNGIFCVMEDSAHVIETLAYQAARPACVHATQSGPMLVIDGALHPRFLPDSTFRNVRNGVGTSADGKTVHFVISNDSVTFHEMATFFRDHLKTPNALYFDGRVSKLHAPALGRSDIGQTMGPILSVKE